MNKDKLNRNRYIIIYYDLCKDLNVQYESYMVLQTMLHNSKGNNYTKGVSSLSKYLCLSRNTVYKSLKELECKEHIEKQGNNYFLHSDLPEKFRQPKGYYLKIYPKLFEVYRLNVNDAALLYLFYSYSLRFGKATAKCKTYLQYINIGEAQYFHIKNKLRDKKLIRLFEANTIEVLESCQSLFKNQSIELTAQKSEAGVQKSEAGIQKSEI